MQSEESRYKRRDDLPLLPLLPLQPASIQGSACNGNPQHAVAAVADAVASAADVVSLLERLAAAEVVFIVDGGSLRFSAPAGTVDERTREQIVQHKPELVRLLTSSENPLRLRPITIGAKHVHAYPDPAFPAWTLADELRLRAHLRHLATADGLAAVYLERGCAMHHDRI